MPLVHVPVPADALEQTVGVWYPFIEKLAQRTRQHVQQLLEEIRSGTVSLHIAWEPEERKAYALLGLRVLLRGDDRVAEIWWMTGMQRERWLGLWPELERYCKEHLGCVSIKAAPRPGWSKEMKARGYRCTHIVFEKDI